MRFLLAYIKLINGINEWIGKLFCWTIVVLVFITVMEVVLRRFFNSPTIWSFEVSLQLYGFYFMILAAHTLLHGNHVSIDIIYNILSVRTRLILDIIGYLIFFFPFTFILLWKGFGFAKMSWESLETSWSVFQPPLYMIKTVIPLTAFLLIMQGIAIFIQTIYMLVKRKELSID